MVDNEADELEIQIARYKPESLDNLCKTTKFSKKELQIMYRGFKQVPLFSTPNYRSSSCIWYPFLPPLTRAYSVKVS